jgi:hypothetical protein
MEKFSSLSLEMTQLWERNIRDGIKIIQNWLIWPIPRVGAPMPYMVVVPPTDNTADPLMPSCLSSSLPPLPLLVRMPPNRTGCPRDL